MATITHINVAVHGASGRVGREVLRAVAEANDMRLSAAIDRFPKSELPRLPVDVPYHTSINQALQDHPTDVVVDFSVASASIAMLSAVVNAGVSPVIGTTGYTAEQIESLRKLCSEQGVGALLAPNFTIGAVLLSKLASLAAPYFEYVDIAEEHHEMKIDSPSGTALGIAHAISEAHESRFARNVPEREPIEGARGAEYNGITVHATRMPGRLAHHPVTFGGPGQTLSLRHDTIDRQCYMPGVLLAIRQVRDQSGLVIGLDKIMGL